MIPFPSHKKVKLYLQDVYPANKKFYPHKPYALSNLTKKHNKKIIAYHSIFDDPPSCAVINDVTSLVVTPSANRPVAASSASGQALCKV